ncbi:MAG TPA: hypothetical protein VMU39_04890 [Solirubrobacteraceae bacterium]|nr:hypothetical protein [Solirubrobacteraceae bacterium]
MTVTALLVALAPGLYSWIRAPAALARSALALYYETKTMSGSLAIDRLSLSIPRAPEQVVAVGDATVFGLAVAWPYLYWSFQAGVTGRGAIMRASLNSHRVRRLVGGLDSPASLVAAHGFVYWSDRNAIGRVAVDGSHLQRRFLGLSRETGGGVADGLASDESHLYFSRCLDHTIGRADLDGDHLDPRLLSLGHASCPQGIAVAGRYVYWTELGIGTIGRATVDGRGANRRWLSVRTDQGPFQVVADSAHLYWSWGGVDGSPSYTGRANADGSNLDPVFLPNSLYPMALSGA